MSSMDEKRMTADILIAYLNLQAQTPVRERKESELTPDAIADYFAIIYNRICDL